VVDDAGVGGEVPCPACKAVVHIPEVAFKCSCPHCGALLEVSADMRGETFKCTSCNIEVPWVKKAPLQQTEMPSRNQILNAAIDPGSLWQPEPESSSRKCPSCGTAVQQDAVICVNCGLNFKTGKKIASDLDAEPGVDVDETSPSAVATAPPIASPAPKCPSCGAVLQHDFVICVQCGLNFKTGETVKAPNRSQHTTPSDSPVLEGRRDPPPGGTVESTVRPQETRLKTQGIAPNGNQQQPAIPPPASTSPTMKKFRYTALDRSGKEIAGVLDGHDPNTVIRQLQQMGFTPTAVGDASFVPH